MALTIKSTWNRKHGTTKVTLGKWWNMLSPVEKADHLKDTIYELENIYDEILRKGLYEPAS